MARLLNCWEILKCGREYGGEKVSELGECVASKTRCGHCCWAIAGTLCGGVVQGTFAEKGADCMQCEVFKRYNMFTGLDRERFEKECPEEVERFDELMLNKLLMRKRSAD